MSGVDVCSAESLEPIALDSHSGKPYHLGPPALSPYVLVGGEWALASNDGCLNSCIDSQRCGDLSNAAPSPCKEASDRDCGSDTCRDTCHVCGKYLSGFVLTL